MKTWSSHNICSDFTTMRSNNLDLFFFCKKILIRVLQVVVLSMLWVYTYVKVADLKAYNFIKKRLQHRRFPVNIAKFL